jgi:hypothetical protein
MTETYSVGLALFDFVPSLAFLVGAYFLVQMTMQLRGKRCGRMAMLGTALVFLGGLLKATWKLLYALEVADLRVISEVQFILLAPGFLAMVIAIILMARRQGKAFAASPLMAMALWKIPFLFVMTVCSLGVHGILTYLAFRWGVKLAAAAFALAFIGTLAMAGMASAPQTIPMQWIEESTNTLGQIGFAVGSILLHRKVSQ